MLDVELFGMNAGGHHMTNVIIHAANAALLFLALERLAKQLWPAFLTAALFAWHPLHVESVAWVAERKDVLCAFFWFLGLWCYAGYVEAPSRRRFAGVTLCLAMGLMSKPMILTFPFQLLLLDVWPLRRVHFRQGEPVSRFFSSMRPLVREKIPFFAMIAAIAAATAIAQHQVGAVIPENIHPLAARLVNAPVAYARYVGLTFWPTNLAIMYPMPHEWPAWQVAGALSLLMVLTWFCVSRAAHEPSLAVGWFWFLGTLVPVIGLIQVGDQSIANRYTYVPLVGLFIAVVWGMDSIRRARRIPQHWLTAAAGAVLLMCLISTREELWHWRNGVTIFERAVQVTSGNFTALTNLGNSLLRLGDRPRAIALYKQALEVRQDSSETHYNLAVALGETGESKASEHHYRETLRWRPKHANAHNNLANLLSDTGRTAEALKHHEECLRLSPDNLEARFNYGITLTDIGKPAEAIAQFEVVVRHQPSFTRARLQLVSLYIGFGKVSAALAHNDELLRHDPASPEGRFNAGSFASARGDWKSAVQHWQEAVRLKADFQPALHQLAWTYATHPSPAVRHPEAALELAVRCAKLAGPKSAQALDLLAVAHAANGSFERAVEHAQQALAAAGTNAAVAAEIRGRLALFQGGKPFIEGATR
ncbi:MAG: tetratricopeptide repeat protein [Limisphaerales bacterium]